MNAKTRRTTLSASILAAVLALTGCAAASSSTPSAPASHTSSAAPAVATSAAPAPSPSPSTVMCTSHSCIVQVLQLSLVGGIAQDDAVATKVTCYESTVVYYKAAGTWSASCTVGYSDGSTASGTGNLIVASSKVTFEPAD